MPGSQTAGGGGGDRPREREQQIQRACGEGAWLVPSAVRVQDNEMSSEGQEGAGSLTGLLARVRSVEATGRF